MDEDGFIPIGSVPFPVFTQKRYKESDGESDGESDVTVELISTDGQLLKPEESYEKLRKKLESSCKKHYATEALQLSNLLDGLLTKASQKPLNQQALDNLLLETLTFGVSHPLLAPTLFKATANYFLQGSENLKLLYEALTTDHVDKVNTRTKRPKIQQAINAIAPDNEKTKKNQLLLSLRYSVNATLSIEPPLYDYKNIDIYYNLPGINFRKYGDHANFLFFYFSPVPKDENTKRNTKNLYIDEGLTYLKSLFPLPKDNAPNQVTSAQPLWAKIHEINLEKDNYKEIYFWEDELRAIHEAMLNDNQRKNSKIASKVEMETRHCFNYKNPFGFSYTLSDNFKGANLAEADLSFMHFFGNDFSYADLSGATFHAPLESSNNYANEEKQKLVNINLSYSNLENATLDHSEYYGVNIKGASTKDAKFNFEPYEGPEERGNSTFYNKQITQHAPRMKIKATAKKRGISLNNIDENGNLTPGLSNGTAEVVFNSTWEKSGVGKKLIYSANDVALFPSTEKKQERPFSIEENKHEMRSTLLLYGSIRQHRGIPEKTTAIENLVDTADNSTNKNYEDDVEAWKKKKLSNTSNETNWEVCRKRANPNFDKARDSLSSMWRAILPANSPANETPTNVDDFINKTLEISKSRSNNSAT